MDAWFLCLYRKLKRGKESPHTPVCNDLPSLLKTTHTLLCNHIIENASLATSLSLSHLQEGLPTRRDVFLKKQKRCHLSLC